jgi:hypothetical protein
MKRRCAHKLVRFLLIVLTIVDASAYCRAESPAILHGPETCRYSDQVYDSDISLMHRESPTRLRLMTSRYVQMVQAARGYDCSGTVTVAFNGHNYMQAGRNDDPGIMELVPTVSRLIGMSLETTYDVIVFVVAFLGILIGYAGFWRLYPNQKLRWAGVAVFLCLGLAEIRVADVYMFQISPLIAGIPWVLNYGLRSETFALNVSAVLLAICCSLCSLVRIGTTAICMSFLITMFIARSRIQKPFLPLLLIILACVPSTLLKRSLIDRRDAKLATFNERATAEDTHPTWHSIYIGLGFVPNSEVPGYNDAVAAEKVKSLDPTVAYTSAQYEAILRREVFRITTQKPMLLIENLLAKVGIVILLALVLLYPSRRLIFAERAVFWMDAAFGVSIGVSAINAIVAVPRLSYLLTFLCLTFLYSAIKLCGESYRSESRKASLV